MSYARCTCGKVTTFKCHELWPPDTLVPCNAPLCVSGCPEHRHEAGTMGYVKWDTASAQYCGDEPDGPGFIEWLKCMWRRTIWSTQKKAQWTWDRMRTDFKPPAPLPRFELHFGDVVYKATDGINMIRVKIDGPSSSQRNITEWK